MPRWLGVVVVVIILVLFAGMGVVYVQRTRVEADMLRCQNHLREIGLFSARPAVGAAPNPHLRNAVPAGTIDTSAAKPTDRLSWYATAIPWLDQKLLPEADLFARIDRHQPWNSATNAEAARLKLPMLLCPGLPPTVVPNEPAPTSYFGTSGLGVDAAALRIRKADLRLGNFGDWQLWAIPPEAGCFRYDAPTPFEAIEDGLAQTIMIGEREPSPGPWLQGGPATVRGYDTSANAPPPIGFGGQFGGGHPAAANFAFADGHVAPISIHVDPQVLKTQLTIRGAVRNEE